MQDARQMLRTAGCWPEHTLSWMLAFCFRCWLYARAAAVHVLVCVAAVGCSALSGKQCWLSRARACCSWGRGPWAFTRGTPQTTTQHTLLRQMHAHTHAPPPLRPSRPYMHPRPCGLIVSVAGCVDAPCSKDGCSMV